MTKLIPLRMVLVNALLVSVTGLLAIRGLLVPVYRDDDSGLTYVITALFVAATAQVFTRVVRAERATRSGDLRGVLSERAKTDWLTAAGRWMVSLGLIGTVIGFSIALLGIGEDSSSSASNAEATIRPLLSGMGVAIYTTLVGSVAALWHDVNLQFLRSVTGDRR